MVRGVLPRVANVAGPARGAQEGSYFQGVLFSSSCIFLSLFAVCKYNVIFAMNFFFMNECSLSFCHLPLSSCSARCVPTGDVWWEVIQLDVHYWVGHISAAELMML